MPFIGPQLMARDICKICYEVGWHDLHLIKMVAVARGESRGNVRAINDNKDEDGNILSRDVGLFQINIPASQIGTEYEDRLYDPKYNALVAWSMYQVRGYQPWVAYTSGWVMFPNWWVWTQKEPHHWAPTGRFLHIALRGWANFQVMERGLLLPIALEAANRYVDRLGIKGAVLVEGAFPNRAAIDWTPPPQKPTAPPADGVGPRPKPMSGLS